MELKNNPNLRKHFCKIMGLPIKIYVSPYFESRIKLFDAEKNFYDFVEMIENTFHGNYEDFNHYYYAIQDEIIRDIKEQEGYQDFISENMNKYAIPEQFRNISSKDIYKEPNNGKVYISFDMKKANFSALKHYNASIFGPNVTSYGSFIQRYSDNYFLVKSKHMRQVIFGNCNPKRQATYEKYLMSIALQETLDSGLFTLDDMVCLLTDEIVFDVTGKDLDIYFKADKVVTDILKKHSFSLHCSMFELRKIGGCKGYIKNTGSLDFSYADQIKCVDAVDYPFVVRAVKQEPYTEEDCVYMHEHRMVKLMPDSIPKITI